MFKNTAFNLGAWIPSPFDTLPWQMYNSTEVSLKSEKKQIWRVQGKTISFCESDSPSLEMGSSQPWALLLNTWICIFSTA